MTIWAAFCILSLLWIAAVAIIAGVALAFTYLVGYLHEKSLAQTGQDDDALQ